jgi:hypothetical protein
MTVLAWAKRFWGWFRRLHYTILAIIAAAWVWMLAFWNILGPGF